ncbi:Type I restriction-modification system, specificity subunit S [uncultured Gammaproteobacteria bacterium]|nr:Type I restriction-modification system, specificity subunit S [uncultured Gammaproteobacteria bacterium]
MISGDKQLPKGWEVKKLGEACIVARGSSPRPIKKYLTQDQNGINWIKIGDTKNIEKYIYRTNQKITIEGAKKSRFVEKGDFILSNSMSFGRPYIMKTTGYIHDGWFKLKLYDFLNTEYFYQLLSSPYVNDQFHSLASGSVVKNISGDLVKKVSLPIPPLPEQKRIVKKLDALQTQTKKLETLYQQKINNLVELKKSVLQKAFAGELT